MRKIVLLLALSLTAMTASAQFGGNRSRFEFEWGLMAGLNTTDFTTTLADTDIRNRLGWQAGFAIAAKFGAFAIEPQLLYVHHGLKVMAPSPNNKVKIRSNSIDVPVLFSLRVLRPLRINVGPVLTVMNDCGYKSGLSQTAFGRIRPTVSYMAGVGITLGHKLIDLRYNGQFNSVDAPLPEGDAIIDLRIRSSFALSFGYMF